MIRLLMMFYRSLGPLRRAVHRVFGHGDARTQRTGDAGNPAGGVWTTWTCYCQYILGVTPGTEELPANPSGLRHAWHRRFGHGKYGFAYRSSRRVNVWWEECYCGEILSTGHLQDQPDFCLCEHYPTHQAEDCHVHTTYPLHFDQDGVQTPCDCGSRTGLYPVQLA